MMINVKDFYETKDRWPLKITKLEMGETRSFDQTSGMYYVMLQNSSYYADNVHFEKVNAAIAVSTNFTIKCDSGSAAVIEYMGLHLLESRYYIQEELDLGNLSYIDGGTNTTAINPGRLGDPVINYVHFPAGMYQTLHTHPSHRVGMVVKGKGKVELDDGEFDLKQGDVFFLRRNVLHNFHCPYENEDVILFVFAPDTGTGPTDEVNPLKIRTYIGQQRYAK
jgi:quercetin dioxygenase-like cupin family protein